MAMQSGAIAAGRRFAVAVVWPQLLVLIFVGAAAVATARGLSLVLLLIVATILSIAVASLIWRRVLRWRETPGLLAGAFAGMFAGLVAAALSFGAVTADHYVAPHFGGDLLGQAATAGVKTGIKTGADAYRTGVPGIDTATTLPRAVVGVAGGWLALLAMGAVFVGAVGLPILTGLLGGLAAAMRARRL